MVAAATVKGIVQLSEDSFQNCNSASVDDNNNNDDDKDRDNDDNNNDDDENLELGICVFIPPGLCLAPCGIMLCASLIHYCTFEICVIVIRTHEKGAIGNMILNYSLYRDDFAI